MRSSFGHPRGGDHSMTRALWNPRVRVRTILVLVAAIAILLAAWQEYGNPVRRWRRALRDDNDSMQRWEAASLGIAGKVPGIDAGTAIEELIGALGDPSFRVRQTSCFALARLEATALPAVPALARSLAKDPHPWVRAEAGTA